MGLLLDSACGNSMGLQTFVHRPRSSSRARQASVSWMRGRLSQVLITALTAFIGSVTLVALRSIFPTALLVQRRSALRHLLVALLSPALATGAIAPSCFRLVRRIDGLRRREESAAVSRIS